MTSGNATRYRMTCAQCLRVECRIPMHVMNSAGFVAFNPQGSLMAVQGAYLMPSPSDMLIFGESRGDAGNSQEISWSHGRKQNGGYCKGKLTAHPVIVLLRQTQNVTLCTSTDAHLCLFFKIFHVHIELNNLQARKEHMTDVQRMIQVQEKASSINPDFQRVSPGISNSNENKNNDALILRVTFGPHS